MLKNILDKYSKFYNEVSYLPKIIKLIWNVIPKLTIIWIALLVVQGLLPATIVYLTKVIVDTLVAAFGKGLEWNNISPLVLWGSIMAGIMLLSQLLSRVTNWIETAQADIIQDHINDLIHIKSAQVDLSFYETADFYDHLHRARSQATYRPIELLKTFGSVFQNTITLIAMLGILISYSFILTLALILTTIPVLIIFIYHSIQYHNWYLKVTQDERKSWYYSWLLTHNQPASEIRLFDIAGHFQSIFNDLRKKIRKEKLSILKNQGIKEFILILLTFVFTSFALAWMVIKALYGTITLGDLALLYQAFSRGQNLMKTVLQNLGQIYSNILFLGNLFEFLELEPKIKDPKSPKLIQKDLNDKISFKDVTFFYPDSELPALNNFSLDVKKGQFVAIVGFNGAGKSTIFKLLCRLYDPANGSVKIDGTDIRDIKTSELREMITIMFQDPVKYNASVLQNINISDLKKESNAQIIEKAAQQAGTDDIIKKLPNEYNTLLGRWFDDGTELSIGEWQRIALARAFFRNSPILLLDEPTSAMDSWAENEWMKRFRNLVEGKTSIIITHRFTTAMYADVIYVMSDGKIIESGTHNELIDQGGVYSSSWKNQSTTNLGGKFSELNN